MTFENKFINRKLDISQLKIFGWIAYVHVPNQDKTKLNLKIKNASFFNIPWNNKMSINVSTLPFEIYKWVKIFFMKWVTGIHQWKYRNLESSSTH